MYIGSTGERGLLPMVFEVADRAVNDHKPLAGAFAIVTAQGHGQL